MCYSSGVISPLFTLFSMVFWGVCWPDSSSDRAGEVLPWKSIQFSLNSSHLPIEVDIIVPILQKRILMISEVMLTCPRSVKTSYSLDSSPAFPDHLCELNLRLGIEAALWSLQMESMNVPSKGNPEEGRSVINTQPLSTLLWPSHFCSLSSSLSFLFPMNYLLIFSSISQNFAN